MTNHEDGPSGYFLKFKDDSYMLNVDDRKYLYDSTEKDEAEGDAKRQHEMYQNGGVVVPIKIIEFEKWVKLMEWLEKFRTVAKNARVAFGEATDIWDRSQPGKLYNELEQLLKGEE